MRTVAVGYVFALALLAGFAVRRAHRLQTEFRQPWLPSYTLYLACWGALALLSVVQFVVAPVFLPRSVLQPLLLAVSPLWATALAVALYFLSSFMAGLTGRPLSGRYTLAYVAAWGVAALAITAAGSQGGAGSARLGMAASIVMFVLKTATTYGWTARALWVLRRREDVLDRKGYTTFVLLFLAGCAAFDLAVRNVTAVVGIQTSDGAIAAVQVLMNYPALLWLGPFLRRRALARPVEPVSEEAKASLRELGLSPREADVIELVLLGLSHKEIADRLCIALETVKKHTYNVYRKLGVQNRVQLSYYVQNRARR